MFGTCKVSIPDQWDCLPSPLMKMKLGTFKSYKEDTKAARLVESSGSKDQTTVMKFDPKEESPEPQSLLGASTIEIIISLPSSTQESAKRSINATSVSTN